MRGHDEGLLPAPARGDFRAYGKVYRHLSPEQHAEAHSIANDALVDDEQSVRGDNAVESRSSGSAFDDCVLDGEIGIRADAGRAADDRDGTNRAARFEGDAVVAGDIDFQIDFRTRQRRFVDRRELLTAENERRAAREFVCGAVDRGGFIAQRRKRLREPDRPV